MELSTIFSTSVFLIYASRTSRCYDQNEDFVSFIVIVLLEGVFGILRTGVKGRKKKKLKVGGVFLANFFFYWKVAL